VHKKVITCVCVYMSRERERKTERERERETRHDARTHRCSSALLCSWCCWSAVSQVPMYCCFFLARKINSSASVIHEQYVWVDGCVCVKLRRGVDCIGHAYFDPHIHVLPTHLRLSPRRSIHPGRYMQYADAKGASSSQHSALAYACISKPSLSSSPTRHQTYWISLSLPSRHPPPLL